MQCPAQKEKSLLTDQNFVLPISSANFFHVLPCLVRPQRHFPIVILDLAIHLTRFTKISRPVRHNAAVLSASPRCVGQITQKGVMDAYQPLEMIGKGSFGTVQKANSQTKSISAAWASKPLWARLWFQRLTNVGRLRAGRFAARPMARC